MELNCSLSSIDCVLTFCLQLIVNSSSLWFQWKKVNLFESEDSGAELKQLLDLKKWRTRESQLASPKPFFTNLNSISFPLSLSYLF